MRETTDPIVIEHLSKNYAGQVALNKQAKRGYSRDKRPDCKQVVIGLVLDRDGFPKAHEVFDGNVQDRKTVDEMLDVLEKQVRAVDELDDMVPLLCRQLRGDANALLAL